MTIEELEQYRGMNAEINALNEEIEHMYDTYRSPSFSSTGLFNGEASSPVEQALKKIEKLNEVYTSRLSELNDKKLEIETWLRTLEDTFLIACIRFHYLRGYSWKETSKMVYGYDNYYNARKVVFRYFGREK
jgi:hypothetical protein